MKYAGPSGNATAPADAGLALKPSAAYAAWHSGEKYTWPVTGSSALANNLASSLMRSV
ncbi:MAG: hypothetical protein QOJ67_3564 [Acidimicrobiaceae bacterium]